MPSCNNCCSPLNIQDLACAIWLVPFRQPLYNYNRGWQRPTGWNIPQSFIFITCYVQVSAHNIYSIYIKIYKCYNPSPPPCRSAFTYCEDELPSRIDFGKSKYGGPFTTEQVEDAKVLLRLLLLISIFGATASLLIAAKFLHIFLEKQFNWYIGSYTGISECYAETSLTNSFILAYFC